MKSIKVSENSVSIQCEEVAENGVQRLSSVNGETRNGGSGNGNAAQENHIRKNAESIERPDRIRGGRERVDGLSETESSGVGDGYSERIAANNTGLRSEHRDVDKHEGVVQHEGVEEVAENSDRAGGTDNLSKVFSKDENGEIRFKQLDIDYADGTMRKDRFNIRYKQDVKAVDGYICGEYGVNKEDVTGLYNVTELRSGMKIQGFKTVAEAKKAAQYLNEHATLEDVTFYRGISGDMAKIEKRYLPDLLDLLEVEANNENTVQKSGNPGEVLGGDRLSETGVLGYNAGHGGRGSDNRNAEILPGKPERKPCRAFRNVLNNLLEIRSRESAGRGTLIDDKYSIYSCDDKESAHYEILDIKRNYQGKTDNTIYGTNEKPNALYYMKIYENRNPI